MPKNHPRPNHKLGLIVLAALSCSAPEEEKAHTESSCPESPTAYVFEPDAPESLNEVRLLSEAGFRVAALPLHRSPKDLRGVIWLSSFSSAAPSYTAYMRTYADDLYHFVDRANVLVQVAQDPDVEAVPPFLPTTHSARRGYREVTGVQIVNPSAALLSDINEMPGTVGGKRVRSFADQSGFSVLVAGAADGSDPVLVEGAYGQGRIVLSGLRFDESTENESAAGVAYRAFAQNLLNHTRNVCQRDTEALTLTTGAIEMTEGGFTLVALPDTQVYSLRFPGLFTAQTAWIAENAEALRIAHVIHLGDVVNNNTPLEWERAHTAMSLLDNVVPYVIAPGNHDYGPSGDASTRDTLLNEYFSFEDAATSPTFGGAFENGKLDNTYHLFTAGGHDFIIVALEWGPRDETVDWANRVMAAHPDRLGIFVTHAYLNNNDRRYDHTDTENPQDYNPHKYATPGGVNDGEELWQKLVRRHRFVLTLNGHVLGDGSGYLPSVTDAGNTCHQILANYQMRELGGEGYLRTIHFLADGHTVRVKAYSPLYDSYISAPDQEFSFTLDIP